MALGKFLKQHAVALRYFTETLQLAHRSLDIRHIFRDHRPKP